MAESRFRYATYIRTTPARLWQPLIEPEFTGQYWVETWQDCEWKPGASWKLMIPDGRVGDAGEVLEIEPERRLVLSWRNEFKPELRAMGKLTTPDAIHLATAINHRADDFLTGDRDFGDVDLLRILRIRDLASGTG